METPFLFGCLSFNAFEPFMFYEHCDAPVPRANFILIRMYLIPDLFVHIILPRKRQTTT